MDANPTAARHPAKNLVGASRAPRIKPAPYAKKSAKSSRLIATNIRSCPTRTENERMFDISSPATSGTSFISAITTPKIPKNILDSKHLGSVMRHPKTVEGMPTAPNAAALAWAKKPALMIVPRTATMQKAARRGYLFSRKGSREYIVPRIPDPHRATFKPCDPNRG